MFRRLDLAFPSSLEKLIFDLRSSSLLVAKYVAEPRHMWRIRGRRRYRKENGHLRM